MKLIANIFSVLFLLMGMILMALPDPSCPFGSLYMLFTYIIPGLLMNSKFNNFLQSWNINLSIKNKWAIGFISMFIFGGVSIGISMSGLMSKEIQNIIVLIIINVFILYIGYIKYLSKNECNKLRLDILLQKLNSGEITQEEYNILTK